MVKNLWEEACANIEVKNKLLRLAEIGQKMKWQPIETAPTDRHISILLTDGENVFEGYYVDNEWVKATNENLSFATHWMPLPSPSITADKQEGEGK